MHSLANHAQRIKPCTADHAQRSTLCTALLAYACDKYWYFSLGCNMTPEYWHCLAKCCKALHQSTYAPLLCYISAPHIDAHHLWTAVLQSFYCLCIPATSIAVCCCSSIQSCFASACASIVSSACMPNHPYMHGLHTCPTLVQTTLHVSASSCTVHITILCACIFLFLLHNPPSIHPCLEKDIHL